MRTECADLDPNPVQRVIQDLEFQHLPVKAPWQGLDLLQIFDAGEVAALELKLEGELRVTTTDTFMLSLLGPHLASFQRTHPHIVVEVMVTNHILDLNRRDADVAIRPTQSPPENLRMERGRYSSRRIQIMAASNSA